ncbi:hypothetical protein [Bacillus oleivorans]|nr:hypothetical protein [Bacillus oleivorans]
MILPRFKYSLPTEPGSTLPDDIFYYLCDCHDEGYLPDEDEVYLKFRDRVDREGIEVIEQTVWRFVRIHDMTDIEIKWEGKMP